MKYWWLATNTKGWTFFDDEVGFEDFWPAYNDAGNKRHVFANYESVQNGDKFVGYITYPRQEVVCIGEFTEAMDRAVPIEDQGLSFIITSFLDKPVSLEELKANPICGNLKHFRRGSAVGSLFSISQEQYEQILLLAVPKEASHSEENALDLTTEPATNKEGAARTIYTTTYERSAKNRAIAIAAHGARCEVCGFDYGKTYGALGKGFIEVHHIKPLHTQDGETEIAPVKDLACVCSNCHRMIHRKKNEVVSIEELRRIIRQNQE